MTEAHKLQAQLQQSQKMDAVGQLTGGIAHDFNNLLGIIIGALELQMDVIVANPKAMKLWTLAHNASLRGADLTRRLLAFSSGEQLTAAPAKLDDCIGNVVELARHVLGPEFNLKTTLDQSIPTVLVNAGGLESALLNLIINARDAMPNGGNISISTYVRSVDSTVAPMLNLAGELGDYVCCSVSDSGTGMTQSVLDRVFEPFFTTKARGRGTGLGLSMVYGFAKRSLGGIRIYSEVDQGTSVLLYLPLARQAERPKPVVSKDVAHTGAGTVLIVDDEIAHLEISSEHLRKLGYSVLTAEDGPSALRLLQADVSVDVLITDVIMGGGIDGLELARQVMGIRPGIRIIYSSGFSADALSARSLPLANSLILSKPYRLSELAAIVEQAFTES